MLKEAKKALRVTASYYDSEIAHLLMSGANDLQIAGVVFPNSQGVSFTIGTNDAVTDTSTLTDPLCQRAIITYAAARFGNPPNYVNIKASYDEQKAQLMHATGYTNYGEPAEESDSGEDDSDDEG